LQEEMTKIFYTQAPDFAIKHKGILFAVIREGCRTPFCWCGQIDAGLLCAQSEIV